MKSEHVNAFVTGSFRVIESLFGAPPKRGELQARPSVFTTGQCNVTIGVTGDVQGIVIFGMSLVTADRIASTMIGAPIKTFDALAASAIAEMCNMISGNAMTALSDAGVKCDITPPALIRGTNTKISTLSIPAIIVPLELPVGPLDLTVSLAERKR
ncbi:MAG: chemotaxis protein CheX [Capsulimonadaceae bacterium]|nr:chemotaxis protein CheX [Capsulimonadaceae bacterium]